MGYLESHFESFDSFQVQNDQAKFYIPDSYGFKSFEIVRDELQLLLIKIRKFLQRIIYYNYIWVVTKP